MVDFIQRTKELLLLALIILFIALIAFFFLNVNKLNSETDEAHKNAVGTSNQSYESSNYDYIKDRNSAKIKTEYTRLYTGIGVLIALGGFVIYVSREIKQKRD